MLYDFILYFILFGFCGWVCESVFCSILEKKPVNRGFLNGPICPVYSFGGLIVVYGLAPLRDNLWVLFLGGMLFCTLLEYVTSYILEKLFHTTWWDYSHLRFNINGRVCLQFTVIFGALSVVAVRLLYPPFSAFVAWIPLFAKPWIATVTAIVFLADCATSVYTVLSLNGRLAEFKRITAELRAKFEAEYGGSASLQELMERYRVERELKQEDKAEERRRNLDALIARVDEMKKSARHLFNRRLIRAFPNMRSHKYQEQFAAFKAFLEEQKQKRKKLSKKDPKNS